MIKVEARFIKKKNVSFHWLHPASPKIDQRSENFLMAKIFELQANLTNDKKNRRREHTKKPNHTFLFADDCTLSSE